MKQELLEINKEKLFKTFELFENIVTKCPVYDASKTYSPIELEIFDALTSRFVRVYETAIQLFKTIDNLQSLHIAESFGDLMSNCEKLQIITNQDIWFDMRLIRNKISHDYLPNQLQEMLQFITNEFYSELKNISQRIS